MQLWLYFPFTEPLESDLAKTVEYDMDEQDEEWLNAVNEDRKKNQLDRIDPELFEIMMDRLEKEWFDLTKNLQKPDLAMPSEDSTCAICDDSEGENSNAIVFCDGCNLAVHQDCYGVPYIPEGQWLCRKCTVSPENPVECILCPNEGGAFKQTLQGEWVHLLCAIWIPETRVANEVFMEPITGVNKISKPRWKLKCSICDIRAGACIQCAKSSCFLAFHATCARKEKLLLPMKSAHGAEPVTLTCYCERHLPQEQQVMRTAALEAEEAQEYTTPNSQLAAKSARAYAKTYKPGPPLVPAIVVDRIMLYTEKLRYRKKIDFARMLCRYWSLKREARRGAPLLKRLHLEPWTASAGAKVQTEEDRLMRLDVWSIF
jgi:NuA3 HAT complex component NTO1